MAQTIGDGTVKVAVPQETTLLHSLVNHPPGFWFIFWGEFAERCSYYGMRAILVTYMIQKLCFSPATAGTFFALFVAGCYLLPLAGGWIADNVLGKYTTIVAFSIPYILGHFILGIEHRAFLLIALCLLATGSGVIKPNISTLMGLTYDHFRPGQDQLRTNAFSLFYMSINIGAAISQIAIPYLRTTYSYRTAFAFPAVLMAVAFVIFAVGKPFYAKEVISRARRTSEERSLQWRVVGQLSGLFLLVTFFWAIFDQSGSSWILFAKSNMNLDVQVFGYTVDAEMIQALNPILIVLMLPVLTILWTVLSSRGMKVRATDKMMLGFLLTVVCMGIMAYAGYATGLAPERPLIENGAPVVRDGVAVMESFLPVEQRVSVRWQMLAYVFITIAEILISVTGLELAFVAAPKTMKSFVTSLWLLTVFMANFFLNAPLAQVYPRMAPGNYFAMLAGLLVAVMVCFYFVAQRFNRLAAEQERLQSPSLEQALEETGIGDGIPPGGPATGIKSGE